MYFRVAVDANGKPRNYYIDEYGRRRLDRPIGPSATKSVNFAGSVTPARRRKANPIAQTRAREKSIKSSVIHPGRAPKSSGYGPSGKPTRNNITLISFQHTAFAIQERLFRTLFLVVISPYHFGPLHLTGVFAGAAKVPTRPKLHGKGQIDLRTDESSIKNLSLVYRGGELQPLFMMEEFK